MVCQLGNEGVPIFTINWFFVLSYIKSPFAGLPTAEMAVLLIRGMSNPLELLLTSNTADASGDKELALIATFCELTTLTRKHRTGSRIFRKRFAMLFWFRMFLIVLL